MPQDLADRQRGIATTTFQGTGVSITAEGRRHLGAAIGVSSFVNARFPDGFSKLNAFPR